MFESSFYRADNVKHTNFCVVLKSSKVARLVLKMLNPWDVPQTAKHTVMWDELRNLSFKIVRRTAVLTCWEFHLGQVRTKTQRTCTGFLPNSCHTWYMISKEKLCEHKQTCSKAWKRPRITLEDNDRCRFVCVIQKGKQNEWHHHN
jgi:hypothetical protein